jgi:hypothetical protein
MLDGLEAEAARLALAGSLTQGKRRAATQARSGSNRSREGGLDSDAGRLRGCGIWFAADGQTNPASGGEILVVVVVLVVAGVVVRFPCD